ncbi:MAG: hypothetical protein ACKVS9_19190 [Phycisphaerae bacterium]
MVWEARCVPLWIKDENGLPDGPCSLPLTQNALNPDEVIFFLSNAPSGTPIETLLLVALSRWRIERLFEDSKSELGLVHFEARKFGAITRHLLLTCVSHLFLAEFVQTRRGKKSRSDRVSGAHGDARPGGPVARGRSLFPKSGGIVGGQLTTTQQRNAAAAKSHRKRTLRRLRALGVRLRDLRVCRWSRKQRCSIRS